MLTKSTRHFLTATSTITAPKSLARFL